MALSINIAHIPNTKRFFLCLRQLDFSAHGAFNHSIFTLIHFLIVFQFYSFLGFHHMVSFSNHILHRSLKIWLKFTSISLIHRAIKQGAHHEEHRYNPRSHSMLFICKFWLKANVNWFIFQNIKQILLAFKPTHLSDNLTLAVT